MHVETILIGLSFSHVMDIEFPLFLKRVIIFILEIIKFSQTVLNFDLSCKFSVELYTNSHFCVLIICKPTCKC